MSQREIRSITTRREQLAAGWRRARSVQELGVAVALLAICVILSLTSPPFLQASNVLQVSRQASDYGIMAIGMVFVLTLGEIDLSVGSVLTLVNIATALALRNGWPVSLAVALGLVVGGACGVLNGVLSVVLRVPTIIITLGTMSIYRGVAMVLSKSAPISRFSKDSALFSIGGGDVLHLPAAVIVMLVLAGIGYVLLQHTAFGWRVQAIGSNAQAAHFSGIPIARYKIAVMGLMGMISAVAGIMALAFLRSADPNTGLGSELFVIAAAIIGGTALSGGRGSVPGAILGALIIAVVRNGLVMLGLSPNWGTAVTGAVIIAAVAVGALFQRDGAMKV